MKCIYRLLQCSAEQAWAGIMITNWHGCDVLHLIFAECGNDMSEGK